MDTKNEMTDEMLDMVVGGQGVYTVLPGKAPGTFNIYSSLGGQDALEAYLGGKPMSGKIEISCDVAFSDKDRIRCIQGLEARGYAPSRPK